MTSILILGRFISSLQAIQDTIHVPLATQTTCLSCDVFDPSFQETISDFTRFPLVILDISSCLQGIYPTLNVVDKAINPPQQILLVHQFDGPILKALQKKYPNMRFLHLTQLSSDLSPLISTILPLSMATSM